jgi:hypothetical protein
MKKLLSLLVSLVVIIAIDYAIPIKYSLLNKDSYFFGFESFRNSAKQTLGQNRIILVGGSSLAWGVSAEKLSEGLGLLTLNSGIHGGIGYRRFFRTVTDVIDKSRDIIVISPEYSLVSQGGALGRSDEFCAISIYVLNQYPIDCLGYSINSFFKITWALNVRKKLNLENEYIKEGFNEFGDYTHRVTDNNTISNMADIDVCSNWNIQDLSKKYIPFIDNLISEGYEIVYIPNFIASISCSNREKVRVFHNLMHDKYGIQSFKDTKLFFDEEYFYNSGYHLTEEGVSIKTGIFEEQLGYYLETR